ncbi:hypothetical protein ACFSJW_03825 [Flavobacterium artemisiae]|uniref:DUF3592 domain-containing protein n=1 Tax=Flavobacterium artemisiae TaxID=2126556 RepID=A0ABW4HL04_9FLAO
MKILDFLKNTFSKNNKNYKRNLALLLFFALFLLFSNIEIASLFFGGGFIYGGFYMRNYTKKIEKNGIKTKAKIVDFKIVEVKKRRRSNYPGKSGYEKIKLYFPIVVFKDKNENEITHEVDSNTNFRQVNDLIDIIYLNSSNGYQVLIDSNWRMSQFYIILILIGFYFFVTGLFAAISWLSM